MNPTTPHTQTLPGITCAWFSLLRFRSPLLTESQLFSLPMGTEMFHFPTFPPHPLYIQRWVTPHHWCWVSPFGHPRITARLTTPRGLSRPTTSFIGSWCQGIHRTPLNTYNNTYKQPPPQQPHTNKHAATTTRIKCRHSKKQDKNLCYLSKSREIKMLASTMHFSNNTHPPPTPILRTPPQRTSPNQPSSRHPRQPTTTPQGCSVPKDHGVFSQNPDSVDKPPTPVTQSRHQPSRPHGRPD